MFCSARPVCWCLDPVAVDVIRGESVICCTCTSTAPGASCSSPAIFRAISKFGVGLRERSRHLDVDGRGQAEVEYLADDVGGLGEQLYIGELARAMPSRRVFK